jgi:hypothetical protein
VARRLRWSLGIVLGLLLGLAGARLWAIQQLDNALHSHGVSWEHRSTAPLAVRWEGLSSPLGTAQQLAVRGTWPPSVRVQGPSVDLKQWMARPIQDSEGSSGLSPLRTIPLALTVDELTVRWGERTLMDGLSGPLLPTPNLSGPQGTLRLEHSPAGERVAVATATVPLDLPEIQGSAEIEVTASEQIEVRLRMADAVLSHPLIASQPLPPQALELKLQWNEGAVQIQGTLGEVDFSAEGKAQPSPLALDLQLTIEEAELVDVVAIFGSLVPEAGNAKLSGSMGLSAQLRGPPWQIDPSPSARELSATGVLPQSFRSRMVSWQATNASGIPVRKQTGPAHPDWVSLSEAGWLPMAVVASEDGGFQTHPGYQMTAIRQALSQAKAGERLRGGSTLTQQLAKNLFLSSDRTLVRKLRELLLALELERALSKTAILSLYLNVVELGPGIHGIGAASDAYFLKAPSALTLTEAAWLASILPSPRSAHARARAGKPHRARLRTILARMAARGTLSSSQAEAAKQAPLRFVIE